MTDAVDVLSILGRAASVCRWTVLSSTPWSQRDSSRLQRWRGLSLFDRTSVSLLSRSTTRPLLQGLALLT